MTDQEEATRRVFDFDAFLAEQSPASDSPKPKTARIRGVEHQLVDEIPALMALEVTRLMRANQAGKTATIDGGKALELLASLFVDPDTALRGVGLGQAPPLLLGVVELYVGGATPPPNRKGRRVEAKRRPRSISSSGGRSSRRTSNASTGSTFAGR